MRFQLAIYLTAFAGIVFHFLVRYRDAYTKKEVFSWKDNILFSVYVLFAVMVMVTFRIEISNLLGKIGVDVTQILNSVLIWFFIGYFGDSVWKNVENASQIIYKSLQNTPLPPNPPSVPPINNP